MRCWTRLASLSLLVLLLAGCDRPRAGLAITALDVEARQGRCFLNLRLRYDFSRAVREALRNGVPITIVVENRVEGGRAAGPADSVQHKRRFTVSYHTLSEQYIVHTPRSRGPRSFPTRRAALKAMRRIRAWPLGPCPAEREAAVAARVRLDLTELPPPLRLVAFFSPGWRIGSGWVEAGRP